MPEPSAATDFPVGRDEDGADARCKPGCVDAPASAAYHAEPKHYPLKLDYGKPTERIVCFATREERLAAARKAVRAERKLAREQRAEGRDDG